MTAWESAKVKAEVRAVSTTCDTRPALGSRSAGVPFRRSVNHGLERGHDRQDGEAIRAHRVRGPTRSARRIGSSSAATREETALALAKVD